MTRSDANKMWGGRFAMSPAELMVEINASIGFDKAMAPQDIAGSKAHAEMLARQGIISKADAREILKGLEQVRGEIERGEFEFSVKLEDIHMNVESRLDRADRPGRRPPAHGTVAQRPGGDSISGCMCATVSISSTRLLQELQWALAEKAEAHADVVMPGFTHLQPAQPVTFGHHLLAYVEMLGARPRPVRRCPPAAQRDARSARRRWPARRSRSIATRRPQRSASTGRPPIRSTASRTAISRSRSLAAASISAMHLSRLAEEIVIWMTPQFGFVRLSDRFTTGSSIMPQKRNPDAAELCRAKVGRIAGAFQGLLMVMKGLPLTYSKDMQEDKEVTFDALRAFALAVAAMRGMVEDLEPMPDAMRAAAGRGYSTATDLADWLVRALGCRSARRTM